MRRPARALAVTVGLAASTLLAGCDKPLPKITVQTGGFSTTVSPSTYCFGSSQCRNSARIDLPVVATAADSTVLIDVPRVLATQGWVVRALALDGKRSLGDSGRLHDRHTYRVVSGVGGGGAFLVEVDQLRKGKPDGSRWSFLVKVAQN